MIPYSLYLIAGLFLPLFPLSMLFNVLYGRFHNKYMRCLQLLLWPQAGLAIFSIYGGVVPTWIVVWSLLTSLLYALRALALRDVGLWTSFFATSAWALLWILLGNGAKPLQLALYSLGISVPLILMTLLGAGLERRFGAAYLGLYGGLAHSIPRFSGILVVVVLAIVASPLFPSFFGMLSIILKAVSVEPLVAIGIAIVWLLWSWAGARLLQGLIIGPVRMAATDLTKTTLWFYIAVLGGLVVAGVYWSGEMLWT